MGLIHGKCLWDSPRIGTLTLIYLLLPKLGKFLITRILGNAPVSPRRGNGFEEQAIFFIPENINQIVKILIWLTSVLKKDSHNEVSSSFPSDMITYLKMDQNYSVVFHIRMSSSVLIYHPGPTISKKSTKLPRFTPAIEDLTIQ